MSVETASLSVKSVSDQEVAALRSSEQFDADFYRTAYLDVQESGLDAAAHFLWIGARLGRLRARSQLGQSAPLDVLFVDGTNGTSSTPYRIDRVAEGLVLDGSKVDCIKANQLHQVDGKSLRARHITFFRTPFVEPFSSFAREMRARGKVIAFDIDDLVFDEDQISTIDGYRCLSELEKVGYVRGVRAYRDFVLFADFCTAPTEFLAQRMQLLGKRSFRVRNTLDQSEIDRFKEPRKRTQPGKFVIGYYSGSRTHQADFRNAGHALVRLMEENSAVEFRLVGEFELAEFPRLLEWTSGDRPRVIRVDLMPHSEMLDDQLLCDLIIAPLEVGNPFCESKSELKFFEASLARRPIIASPTQTFRSATWNGEFACLADSPDEWLNAFRSAVQNMDRLEADARRAHDFVLEEYSVRAAASDAFEAYTRTSMAVG